MPGRNIMFKRDYLFWMMVPVVVLGLAGYAAGGGKITEFSADQIFMDPEGALKGMVKIYMAPGKLRMEMNAPDGKGYMITVVRQDEGIHRMIFPEKKGYLERPISNDEAENLMAAFTNSQEKETLGEETVNGFKCKKMRITRTQKAMGREMTTTVTVWKSDRVDWPIRTRSDNGSSTELRNIKEGKQPKDLFEAPAGYKKATNMMELMR
jgi:hypothetical protein